MIGTSASPPSNARRACRKENASTYVHTAAATNRPKIVIAVQ
jgi:hypothetical protein